MKGIVRVKRAMDLVEALELRRRECVALVGAGGKTSMLLGLGGALVKKGARVVITTTTRVGREEAARAPSLVFLSKGKYWRKELSRELDDHGLVFVAGHYCESSKIKGIAPERVDELSQFSFVDYLIVEADGASRRPIKAPGPWEPVIPTSTTTIVGMVGADALGARVDETLVFRVGAFCSVTGAHLGETITPLMVAHLFLKKGGIFRGSPRGGRQVAFLNKTDLLTDPRPAHEWAEIVVSSKESMDRAIVGSIKDRDYEVFETR